MKVYISVDIEGVAGVSDPFQGRPGNAEYEHARRLMTQEASAAVRGAFQGGASSVVVADSHAYMSNIIADQLDHRARFISGSPRRLSMVHGLDASYDALVLVGFHAAAGTRGVMAHTLSGLAFARVEILGRTVGEVELFAGYAAELGVPLVAVTGDDRIAIEVLSIFPGSASVVVKESLGAWASNSLSPQASCELIESSVATSLRAKRNDEITSLHADPFIVNLDMTRQYFADACCLIPELKRTSATGVSFESPNYEHTIRVLQALVYIVMGVQK